MTVCENDSSRECKATVKIAQLEQRVKHLEEIDGYLETDKKRLDGIEDGNRATQRALLALLDHGIDGNNIAQMQKAKEELQEHLISR